MDFFGNFALYVLILIFPTQLVFVYSSYVSKGTVENMVPFERNKTRSAFGSVGRVSKLLSVKKSNLTQNHNEIEPFTSSHFNEVQNISGIASAEKVEFPRLSEKLIQKRQDHGRPIYNRASNPMISSDSWKDLNTIFTDAEMKGFLSSLPIHTLRNLTTVTKKDPELGQKQLVRMILDRSGHLKEKLENSTLFNSKSELNDNTNLSGDDDPENKMTTMKISGHKKNKFSSKILNKNDSISASNIIIPLEEVPNAGEEGITYSEFNTIRPSDQFSSTTTALPVLESPPSGTQHSTPSTEPDRNKRVLPFSNLVKPFKKPEPVTPRQFNSFNSGYFIPSLTSLGSSKPDNLIGQSSNINPSDQSNFSWNNAPQDPENTFHPNLDKFMTPPLPNGNDMASSKDQSSAHSLPSSAVWVKAPSLHSSVGDKNHPFSGFNSEINLQQAASGDQIGNEEYYTHNDSGGGGYEYNSPPGEDPNFHYIHSIKSQGPPPTYIIQGHPPPSSSVLISEPDEKPQTSNNHQIKNSNDGQSNRLKNSFSKNQGNNGNQQNSPSKPTENSPGGHHGWGWDDDSYWSKAKAYFHKGRKTTAEKVFEVSLGVLSFLAFGGYLLMLIYQVFAVSSVVPLFPLFPAVVPQQTTVLGALLGRSSDQESSFAYPGVKVGNDYINQLETIVKGAMDRVKITLSSTNGSEEQVKGDLGH